MHFIVSNKSDNNNNPNNPLNCHSKIIKQNMKQNDPKQTKTVSKFSPVCISLCKINEKE